MNKKGKIIKDKNSHIIYCRYCNTCDKYYEGRGKYFCNPRCLRHTQITKNKIGNFFRNKKLLQKHKIKISNSEKGKIISIETRKKLSKNHADVKGKNNPFYGKKHTEKAREKNRQAHLGKLSKERMGHNNPMWVDGRSYFPYDRNFSNSFKKQIRHRDNYICQKCFKTQEEELEEMGRKLAVHHVDYTKLNCRKDNLITLCLLCNTAVNKNRTYWTSYFTNLIDLLDWT